jgi:hypothetical protein
MKITKEDLKKLIKEVTAAELALQQALERDRKRHQQAGPHLASGEYDEDQGYFGRVGADIERAVSSMYDPEAPVPGDITGPPPVKDPRPQRVTSTASKDPNHVRKFINDLHASGRISRETKIAARRALYGKGGKYDPEMGVEAALAILRDAGVRMELKETYEVVPGTGEEGVTGISVPTQTPVSDEESEQQELEDRAAARKRRAQLWAAMQDEEGRGQSTRATANTKDTSGLRQAEFEDTYAKLYNLYSGEDIGQPGDASRVPDAFAERRPRGSREDFIAKTTLEEIIKEEAKSVLLENKMRRLSSMISLKATFWVKEAGLDDATVKSDPAGAWLDILTMVAPHWSKMGNMAYGCQRAPEDINCRVIDVAQKKLNGLLDQANEGDYQKWVSGNFREVKNTFSYMPANKAPESLKRTSIWPIIEKDLPSGGDDL